MNHLHVLASVLPIQLFNYLSSNHLCITINWFTINHLVGCYDKKVRVFVLGVGDGKVLMSTRLRRCTYMVVNG